MLSLSHRFLFFSQNIGIKANQDGFQSVVIVYIVNMAITHYGTFEKSLGITFTSRATE